MKNTDNSNKLNKELLEDVSGGKKKDTPSVLISNLDNIAESAMGGTAICPVCGKRYDPQFPHICRVD